MSMLKPDPISPALVLLVGAPGAGKTLWRRLGRFAGCQVVNLDRLRWELADSVDDQSVNSAAANIARVRVRERMSRKLFTVVDATNANWGHREQMLRMARRHGVHTVAIVFDVDVETCIARQRDREHPVPVPAVRKIHAAVLKGLPGLPGEVDTIVRVDEKGRAVLEAGDPPSDVLARVLQPVRAISGPDDM